MKRSIMFGVLFSAALAVGAGAQSTGGQTPTQSGSSDQSQVTVTGCLQSDTGAATGTSGAGSTAGSTGAGSTGATGSGASRGGGFVLTNAKMGGSSASGSTAGSSTGTAGSATGSTSSGMAAGMTRIKLEGSQSDLQKYANSQVEVRGKLEKSTRSGSGTTGSATSGATGAAGATGSGAGASGSASTSRQDMPTLQVSSVRQVSPSCSGS